MGPLAIENDHRGRKIHREFKSVTPPKPVWDIKSVSYTRLAQRRWDSGDHDRKEFSSILGAHVIVWWMLGLPQLSAQSSEKLSAWPQPLFVSAASLWECEIERVAGRMPPGADLLEAIAMLDLVCPPIDADDAVSAARLPLHQGDPFDRMLIAHAIRHDLTIVTHDRIFERYGVPVLCT